ncbi:flagellar biosynthetic protein FliR [Geomonas propionica]|uniref:Flagellar biosynthetic protein FliR n=1 Tax=Geomonas propionica TaxID=2798582 RepID=A0ABS0YTG5_9BACT|nr:flagellar biosynthetic protein FliR [Geomonas propionica]MBJ6801267.1 flagellar biosynthetic protein FliR [Geomonas propionica]
MFDALPLKALADLIPFALVLARVAALFMAIPMFGARLVPNRIKVALIFAMTLVIFPIIRLQAVPVDTDSLSLMILVLRETLIGLTLGAISQFVFAAVEFGGQLVGTQMGISIAAQFDPTTQNNVPTIAIFEGALATLIFLALDVHHFFIKGIVESYQVIPLGAWHVSGGLLKFMIQASTGIFVIALKLAAPVSVALLATTVALGIVARSFPAMNVFMVSMPLNIGIGFLILGISLPVFLRVLNVSFGGLVQQMHTLFKLLA